MAEFFRLDGQVALVTGAGRGSAPGSPGGCMPPAPGSPCSTATRPRPGPSPRELDGLDLVGDVRAEDQVAAAVEQAEARLGPLSILVNNAGITGRTDLSWNLQRGRGARGLRGQRDRPVPVLQGRGPADAGPRIRADRQRGLDRRQGGQPDPHALLGLQGRRHRHDQVPGQGAGRQGRHHGQRDLAGRHPHRDPRRRCAGHRRVHDLEDPDRAGPGPSTKSPRWSITWPARKPASRPASATTSAAAGPPTDHQDRPSRPPFDSIATERRMDMPLPPNPDRRDEEERGDRPRAASPGRSGPRPRRLDPAPADPAAGGPLGGTPPVQPPVSALGPLFRNRLERIYACRVAFVHRHQHRGPRATCWGATTGRDGWCACTRTTARKAGAR